jgi:hypothetical protein
MQNKKTILQLYFFLSGGIYNGQTSQLVVENEETVQSSQSAGIESEEAGLSSRSAGGRE